LGGEIDFGAKRGFVWGQKGSPFGKLKGGPFGGGTPKLGEFGPGKKNPTWIINVPQPKKLGAPLKRKEGGKEIVWATNEVTHTRRAKRMRTPPRAPWVVPTPKIECPPPGEPNTRGLIVLPQREVWSTQRRH